MLVFLALLHSFPFLLHSLQFVSFHYPQVDETSVPAFCIRHDVDAVLWQPRREVQFMHLATYNAFGYVRASKTTAKFTCGAPGNVAFLCLVHQDFADSFQVLSNASNAK